MTSSIDSTGTSRTCKVLSVAAGDVGRFEIRADDALGGAGLLDFSNHGRLAGGNFATDGADEIARCRLGCRFDFDCGKRLGSPCGGNFFVLGGNDFIEDVGHGFA